MKFCLSSQLQEKLLAQADEIKTKHRQEVKPLLRKFAKAIVIYEIQPNDAIEAFQELNEIGKEFAGRLVCCCQGVEQMAYLHKYYQNFKVYNGFYTTNYLEARACVDYGASYLKPGAPLTHDLETLSRLETPIRLTPNIACEDAIYLPYGIYGSWIRPEDYAVYDAFNVIYEFEDCDARKEATLYDIYKNKKAWAGPINFLISNLDSNALNRLISTDLAQERIRCKQKCMANGNCHLCKSYLTLADKELLDKIKYN